MQMQHRFPPSPPLRHPADWIAVASSRWCRCTHSRLEVLLLEILLLDFFDKRDRSVVNHKVRGRVLRPVPVAGLCGGGQDPGRASLYSTCSTGTCCSVRLPLLQRGFPGASRRCVRRDFPVDFWMPVFCGVFLWEVMCGHRSFATTLMELLVGGYTHPPSWPYQR